MKIKPKRHHSITRTFALFPRYCLSIKKYVWLEKIWRFCVDTPYGSACWYDVNYRYLHNGFVKPYYNKE